MPLKLRSLFFSCLIGSVFQCIASTNQEAIIPPSANHSKTKSAPISTPPQLLAVQPIEIQAHNPAWFTQGLYKDKNGFFISSGLYGRSSLIYQSQKKTRRYTLPKRYFAEGLTVIGDKLYLLTWKENTVLIFDKNTFQQQGKFTYKGEGWGLTHTDKEFIMSNGSNQLQFRDKNTFEVNRKVTVKGVNYINELEYVDGIIWANRWYDDNLYAIDSKNGCLLAKINLYHLREQATNPNNQNVTNGIAYDKNQKGLWVTGKYWSKRFLIMLPKLEKINC